MFRLLPFASYRSMVTNRSIVAIVLATRHPRIAELLFLLALPQWVWLVTCTPPPGYRFVVVSLSGNNRCGPHGMTSQKESAYDHRCLFRVSSPFLAPIHVWLRPTPVIKTHVLSAELSRLISSLLLLYAKGIFCTLVFLLNLVHGTCVLVFPLLI